MEITEEPWRGRDPAAGRLELVQLPPIVLAALADDDLDGARRATALELTPYLEVLNAPASGGSGIR